MNLVSILSWTKNIKMVISSSWMIFISAGIYEASRAITSFDMLINLKVSQTYFRNYVIPYTLLLFYVIYGIMRIYMGISAQRMEIFGSTSKIKFSPTQQLEINGSAEKYYTL